MGRLQMPLHCVYTITCILLLDGEEEGKFRDRTILSDPGMALVEV